MEEKRISVIVPVYNVEKYLDKCVESIVCQTYKNLEIILVDDGSPDNCPEICDKWAESDDRIKVIHKVNGGVSSARNVGLDAASGEYLTFVDGDDRIDSDMYELLMNLMITHDADISHCGYKRIDPDGNLIKEISGTHKLMIDSSVEALTNILLGRYYVSSVCNKLFKATLFDGIRFDETLKVNEDTLVCFLLFQKSQKIVFQDETKYGYVIYRESVTHVANRLNATYDCIKAAQTMYDSNADEELKPVIHSRLYRLKSNLYKYYLKNDINESEAKELKNWLKENYGNFKGVKIRTKIGYLMLIYMSSIYFKIYKMYFKHRRVNYDVGTK